MATKIETVWAALDSLLDYAKTVNSCTRWTRHSRGTVCLRN